MHGRGGAGEIVDLVHLDVERKGDVVAHRLEMRVSKEVRNVVLAAGEIIVDAENIVAGSEQAFAEMGAEETRPAGHQHAFARERHADGSFPRRRRKITDRRAQRKDLTLLQGLTGSGRLAVCGGDSETEAAIFIFT